MSAEKHLNSSFINGFEKRASLGSKALQPLSSTGKMIGNKPSSMVSTIAAYKPTSIPTAKPSSPSNNLSTKLPSSDKINTNHKPKPTRRAAGGIHL